MREQQDEGCKSLLCHCLHGLAEEKSSWSLLTALTWSMFRERQQNVITWKAYRTV